MRTPRAGTTLYLADKKYIIQPGDSWTSMAKKLLGDERRFTELYGAAQQDNFDDAWRSPEAVTTATVNPVTIINPVARHPSQAGPWFRVKCDYCGRRPESNEQFCKGCGAPL